MNTHHTENENTQTTPTEATPTEPVVVKLSNNVTSLADKLADVRGYQVVGNDGNEIGDVDDLLVDDYEGKVHFLEVKTGGFLGLGRDNLLIPIGTIDNIDRAEQRIRLNQTESAIKEAPNYDPDAENDRPYYQSIYHHYGLEPYWSRGYTYPPFPHI